MTFLFIAVATLVGGALGLLLWSTGHRSSPVAGSLDQLNEQALTCKHATNFQQVRQIFEASDLQYLRAKAGKAALGKILKERHRVARKFLEGLREDFMRLEEVSSTVAAFSAEVDAGQEWRRMRLAAEFRIKYGALRIKYAIGLGKHDSFRELAWMVSSLAVELEHAINELAAAAALAQSQRPSPQA